MPDVFLIIIAEILTSCIWCWNCTGLLGSFAVLNKICNNSFFQPSLFPSVLVECNAIIFDRKPNTSTHHL